MELWDKAMWKGMIFGFAPGRLPIMAPVFTNIDAGKAIFAEWRKMVGKQDENDLIKVGLIKEINKDKPLKASKSPHLYKCEHSRLVFFKNFKMIW